MSAARAQTVLPLDPPKKRRRQSSHEPNSNKRWEPKDDARLVKLIRLPGWNIIAVARELGRPKKGIYNRAVMHYKAGRIASIPSWSDLMAQTDPLLVPPGAPSGAEILAAVHTPGAVAPLHDPSPVDPAPLDGESLREAFLAAPADAVVSKRLPRSGHRPAAASAPVPVPGTAGVFVQAPVSVANQLMQTVLAALAAVDAPFDGVTVQFVRGE